MDEYGHDEDQDIAPAALAAALDFYRHIGVDLAFDDAPRNRYRDSLDNARASARQDKRPDVRLEARPLTPAAPARAPKPNPLLVADIGQIAASAAQQAGAARDLDELRARLEAFEGCALKTTATRLVFEDGARDAAVMIVGEAPGADEDREGRPFVGRAGQLLDKMLAAIKLDRTSVYIANVIPWRPPGNRTPTPQEAAACLPFVRRQVELVAPKFLICLGASSMQALLGTREGILKSRGIWRPYALHVDSPEETIPAMAMLHPAYLLRQPAVKKLAWADLCKLRRALDGEGAVL